MKHLNKTVFFFFFLMCFLGGQETSSMAADGWSEYNNARFGYTIPFPTMLAPQGEAENGDGQVFLSSDKECSLTVFAGFNALEQSLKELYEEAQKDKSNVSLRKLSKNFFVLSGTESGKIYYQKTVLAKDLVVTFILNYPSSRKAEFDPIVGKIAKTFPGGEVNGRAGGLEKVDSTTNPRIQRR